MSKQTDSPAEIIQMPDCRRQVRQASGLLLGLDHDATLAPFEAAPIDAKPLPGVDLPGQGSHETGYILKPVELSEEEMQPYSFGFANGILWPLFHDLPPRCTFAPADWKVYGQVNDKLARVRRFLEPKKTAALPFRHAEPSRPSSPAPALQVQSAMTFH